MSARIKQWTHGRSFTASSLYNLKTNSKVRVKRTSNQALHRLSLTNSTRYSRKVFYTKMCVMLRYFVCLKFVTKLNRTFLPIYNWTILDHWAGKECCLLLTITTGSLPQHLTLFNIHYIIKYMFWMIYCRAIVFLLFRISLRSCILKLGLKL